MHHRLLSLLALTLQLGLPVYAEDTKPSEPTKPAEASKPAAPAAEAKSSEPAKAATPAKPATPPYTGPAANVLSALKTQSKENLVKIAAFLTEHRVEFDSMSDSERAAFFDKQLALAEPARSSRPGNRGPSPEIRAKYEALSEAGREKVRTLFRDNRDKLMTMSEEQRRSFLESGFKKIAEEDKGSGGTGDKGSDKTNRKDQGN